MALAYEKINKGEKITKINEVLTKVGLDNFNNKKIYTLSGGEQQRIALARTILKKGDIILADEPTGNLDEGNKEIVLKILKELKSLGKTIIIVTHDLNIANECDEIIKL